MVSKGWYYKIFVIIITEVKSFTVIIIITSIIDFQVNLLQQNVILAFINHGHCYWTLLVNQNYINSTLFLLVLTYYCDLQMYTGDGQQI